MSQSSSSANSFSKPAHFDRDIVVIGAGSGGLVSAYIGSAVKAKVSLIEKHQMGGDCLNTGCVPSKALIRSSKLMHNIKHSQKYGVEKASGEIDFAKTMERVHKVIAKIEPHDSPERYHSLGVDVIQGEGRITSPWSVEVNGQTLTTRNIVIATGGSPFVPPIKGLDQVNYLTSHNLWELKEKPEKLVVLGGGPIGSELSQAFARLGSIKVMTKTNAIAVEVNEDEKVLVCEQGAETIRVPFDQIIVAVGRKPNTTGFGLEELGIELTDRGTIKTNDYLQTPKYTNIYAVGDVAGPYQFTHVAAHQAWYAAVNSLFGLFWKFRADYRVIPAIADSSDHGLVKVLTKPGKDTILGVTIAGEHAGDLIAEYVLAMKHGLGLNKILGTIHIYPTSAEMNKYVAGEWKRAHQPETVLKWLEKFHTWRRGKAA